MRGATSGYDEAAFIDDPSLNLELVDQSHLLRVEDRSAEPIALYEQYILVGEAVSAETAIATLDERITVTYDMDGIAYFKRMRRVGNTMVVLESLNPDGTAPAEVLSLSDAGDYATLDKVLPVYGVLFELQQSSKDES